MRYDKYNKKIDNLKTQLKEKEKEITELNQKINSIIDLKHETSRLNAEILAKSEELHTEVTKKKSNIDYKKVSDLSNTIYHTASMTSSRIIYSEIEINPNILSEQPKFTAVIYKKFDKARYVLYSESERKKLKINFSGNSDYSIQAINAFDCVPFIILDNAIKYAPKNTIIDISFNDTNSDLEVMISSMGPKVRKENLANLFNRGFRDPNTKHISGQGLGLYIARNLCDLHNIEMTVDSDYNKGKCTLEGIEYCLFIVKLRLIK